MFRDPTWTCIIVSIIHLLAVCTHLVLSGVSSFLGNTYFIPKFGPWLWAGHPFIFLIYCCLVLGGRACMWALHESCLLICSFALSGEPHGRMESSCPLLQGRPHTTYERCHRVVIHVHHYADFFSLLSMSLSYFMISILHFDMVSEREVGPSREDIGMFMWTEEIFYMFWWCLHERRYYLLEFSISYWIFNLGTQLPWKVCHGWPKSRLYIKASPISHLHMADNTQGCFAHRCLCPLFLLCPRRVIEYCHGTLCMGWQRRYSYRQVTTAACWHYRQIGHPHGKDR